VHRPGTSPSPLSERHINSPPPPKRVPLKKDATDTPTHKKSGSSVSLKGLILGKDKTSDCGSISSTEGRRTKSPKKVKSSTNLSGLLKKKSRKDLRDEGGESENTPPTRQPAPHTTPLWAQFTTQPLPAGGGTMHDPSSKNRTIEDEINLYTPKDYSEFRPAEQRNFYGYGASSLDYKLPPRPFLEHKSSRSSIFTENMDDDVSEGDEKSALKRRPSGEHRTRRPGSSPVRDARPALETRGSDSSQPENRPKRSSRALDVIQAFNTKSRREAAVSTPEGAGDGSEPLSAEELDSAFEKVLDSLNIPHNMRDNMRKLKPDVKAGLVKGDRMGSGSSTAAPPAEVRSSARRPAKETETPKSRDGDGKDGKRARSRSRTRSRILTLSKRDEASPSKQDKPDPSGSRSRSKSRTKSADMTSSRPYSKAAPSTLSVTSLAAAADSATTPGDFIHYLGEVQKPELVDVGKVHKLRILLRNESVAWTDHFVTKGGMDELVQLFYRIAQVEWREEHEDNLLHETLLCLKALCTTSLALQRLDQVAHEFFPALLAMLFDPERKGPSEFSTRAVIVSLLFSHLSAALDLDPGPREHRARTILAFLKDPTPDEGKQPLDFVSRMHVPRPYRVWCKEVVNVTKEVFWIFLHHLNVIPILDDPDAADRRDYARAHFPSPRPPQPAAPYVGGVEWEATQYLATHLDLLNGLMAALSTMEERNQLREHLKQSGWEKVMGGSLRTCKEKFYSAVHDGLKVWVAAAKADGWEVESVRAGPPREESSPKKSPVKKKTDHEAPQIDLEVAEGIPTLDYGWA